MLALHDILQFANMYQYSFVFHSFYKIILFALNITGNMSEENPPKKVRVSEKRFCYLCDSFGFRFSEVSIKCWAR